MAEYKIDMRDLKFVLFEQLKVQELLGKAPYAEYDRETLEMMLEMAAKFSADVLMPMNETADKIGVKLVDGKVITPPGMKEAYKTFVENGWVGLTLDPQYGGQGAPWVLGSAASEILEGASLAFSLTRLLTAGAAGLILTFGTDELKDTYVERMLTGEWTGTMCLTEAGAGSDVGASRTTAVPEGDHYLIEGEKVFITSGDHDLADNVIHAVLARTPGAPPGTKGISLFVVPKMRLNADGSLGEFNNVVCTRLEEKLGIHASPTCVLAFGADGPCHGYLLGDECGGMREMFQMMNEARLSVGVEGAALGNAAYQQALVFAGERIQGRDMTRRKKGAVSILHHPDVRMMLLWQKAHAEGIRALGYFTAACVDRSEVAKAAGDEEQGAFWHNMLEMLTPVCKAYGSDVGNKICDSAVQVHGGYGYTTDYVAEQYLRDVRITRIYEGTNGIQALDLVARKLRMNGGASAMAMMKYFYGMAAEISGPGLEGVARHAKGGLDALSRAATGFGKMGKVNPLGPIVNATGFLELTGDALVGVLLGQQATLAAKALGKHAAQKGVDPTDVEAVHAMTFEDGEARFYWGKIAAARFFAERVLAMAGAKADVLLSPDMSCMEMVFTEES